MSGEELEIKTESIDIKEEWQIDLNHPNVKKENEFNAQTKSLFVPEVLHFDILESRQIKSKISNSKINGSKC